MKREEYIDICKGIGIILVIIGHMAIPQVALRFIFSFHMPLFVFLSGLVFKQERLRKNINSIGISFLCFAFLVSAPISFYHAIKEHSLSEIGHMLIAIGGVEQLRTIELMPRLLYGF